MKQENSKLMDMAKNFLKNYDGPQITLMEVCGTHTAEISHHGIPSMLSSKIKLVSGPGCPVCVTVTSYIDKLIELSLMPDNVVVTFGDMLHVTGKKMSLSDAKSIGAKVLMVYSPLDMISLAKENPSKTYIFAAIGFETTTPVYAILLEKAIENNISNIKFLTSLKTMPNAIKWVCDRQTGIDGFLAPGHVSTITGSKMYEELAAKYQIPFAITGFTGEQIIEGLAVLTIHHNQGKVLNIYPSFVTEQGNEIAQKIVEKYFESSDASWRGFGLIKDSGMVLRDEYDYFDAGSKDLRLDEAHNPRCCCARVLTGEMNPNQCPLFGNECTPQTQQGACMVSREGTCYHYYVNKRK